MEEKKPNSRLVLAEAAGGVGGGHDLQGTGLRSVMESPSSADLAQINAGVALLEFHQQRSSELTGVNITEIGSRNDAIMRYEIGGVNQTGGVEAWYWELSQPLIPQAAVRTDRVVKSTGGKN